MAKKSKPEELELEQDSAVILFTALGLILVAFFIMLNNLATPDSARTRAALDSLVGTFGMMPGHRIDGAGALPRMPSGDQAEAELFSRVNDILQRSTILGAHAEQNDEGRIVIRFEQELLFNTAGSRISPRYFPVLDDLGALIVEMGYPVRIDGHTDATPAGPTHSNWYHSASRAGAVHRYLEGTEEVPPGLIRTAGFAATQPREDLGTPFDAAQRRVEVIFLPSER